MGRAYPAPTGVLHLDLDLEQLPARTVGSLLRRRFLLPPLPRVRSSPHLVIVLQARIEGDGIKPSPFFMRAARRAADWQRAVRLQSSPPQRHSRQLRQLENRADLRQELGVRRKARESLAE